MKIFICYRRHDSIHAAQRVKTYLQLQFGDDAVFIDQEIPPAVDWQQHLDHMLEQCTDVVVLIGDEFLRRLRRGKAAKEAADPITDDVLVQEIATAIRLRRTIYPFLFGRVDMPERAKLPESIQDFGRRQAIFAREPAFDSALVVLGNALRAEHRLDPAPASTGSAAGGVGALSLPQASLLLLVGATLVWFLGSLISLLGDLPEHDGPQLQLDFLRGAHYVLCTALLGLGPYAAYWLVAVLRARARLPIRNVSGLLAAFNVGGALILGGIFLLLSTNPGWRLKPLLFFPAAPTLLDYALLALALLAVAVATVCIAVWEPRIRTLESGHRSVGIAAIDTVGFVVVLIQILFALSLLTSAPMSPEADPVARLGYLMLCPTMSLLYAYGWKFGQKHLDARERGREYVFLLAIVAGLLLFCTLSLYAYGVAPMFKAF